LLQNALIRVGGWCIEKRLEVGVGMDLQGADKRRRSGEKRCARGIASNRRQQGELIQGLM
jgi:hypothetical protein